jgi:hypothetical protein
VVGNRTLKKELLSIPYDEMTALFDAVEWFCVMSTERSLNYFWKGKIIIGLNAE